MELKNGRPVDCNGRLEKEVRTYDFLDKLGIEYKRLDHEAAMAMEVCEEIDKALQATICKNLFLCNRQETDFYLLMMPGDKKFKTKDLSKELGVSRLSFAKESYMEQYLDITPGSVSVMGLMNDKENKVRLVIDEEVLQGAEVGCHPCINTSSIKFATKDLTEKIIPAMKHDYTMVALPRYEEDYLDKKPSDHKDTVAEF
ncbi:MAG: prolyl-tRNA synthetase associated domain-containing protein [Clostridium sp.]|nr:prolyl-tRNA synthetase associated domain-containing protein [Clostridium sp.]MCM1568750.1 prolyl-tRNA synthetase associated domain-containing protein [Roseburia sp.]